MSDDLDLRGIDQRHEPDPQFRAALRRRVDEILAGSDPGSVNETRDFATIGLEPTHARSVPRRRSRRVTHGIVALASAAAVVAAMVIVTRDDATAPGDTPIPSPLETPSRDEVAAASNADVYLPGSGPTVVTAIRSYVSLRSGPEGWAYVTGSADSPDVHYGLLGVADGLVLSAINDRLVVAWLPPLSQDPPSAPPAWLIDSVTGQRGALRWVDQPTATHSPEHESALPFPHPNQSGQQFLAHVVDRRDWTIRPLSVPENAVALELHQPGVGRTWIGTAPDGGEVGLAYTDDGGASWTDVELPSSLRRTKEELLDPEDDDLLVLAASGDNIAVAARWVMSGVDQRLFASADAGETWQVVPVDAENGRLLFVMDERLVFAVSSDYYLTDVFVSRSAADWSRLEEIEDLPYSGLGENRAEIRMGQGGVASLFRFVGGQSFFSTDLSEWWSIPSLPPEQRGGPGQ